MFKQVVSICAVVMFVVGGAYAAPLSVRVGDHSFTFDVPYWAADSSGAVYDYHGAAADELNVGGSYDPNAPNHYVGSYSYMGESVTVPGAPAPSPYLYPVAHNDHLGLMFGGDLRLSMEFSSNDGPYTDGSGDSFDINLSGATGHLTITGRILSPVFPFGTIFPAPAADTVLLDIVFDEVTLLARINEDRIFLVEGRGELTTLLGYDVATNPDLPGGAVAFLKFLVEEPDEGPASWIFTNPNYDPMIDLANASGVAQFIGHIPGGGTATPEPGTIALLSLGAIAVVFYRRRRRSACIKSLVKAVRTAEGVRPMFKQVVSICAVVMFVVGGAYAAPLSVRVGDHSFTFDVPYWAADSSGAVYDYHGAAADELNVGGSYDPNAPNHYVGSYSYMGESVTVPGAPAPSPYLYPVAHNDHLGLMFGGDLRLSMEFSSNDGPYTDGSGDSFDINLSGATGHLTITGRILSPVFPFGTIFPAPAADTVLLDIVFDEVTLLARINEDRIFLVEGRGELTTLLGYDVATNPDLPGGAVAFLKFLVEEPDEGPASWIFTNPNYDPMIDLANASGVAQFIGHIPGGGTATPEPGTVALLSLGAIGIVFHRRRRRSA